MGSHLNAGKAHAPLWSPHGEMAPAPVSSKHSFSLHFAMSRSECCCCLVISVVSDSMWPHGLQPTRFLCPWDSLGKSTEVDCNALLQGIFPTQGSNLGLLHCRQILYRWATREAPEVNVTHQMSNIQTWRHEIACAFYCRTPGLLE